MAGHPLDLLVPATRPLPPAGPPQAAVRERRSHQMPVRGSSTGMKT